MSGTNGMLVEQYLHDVPIGRFQEWEMNPLKRARISDERLELSIRRHGVLEPLAVCENSAPHPQERWDLLVVDGNRRLRIARRIGLPNLHAIKYQAKAEMLAVVFNTTRRNWDQQTLAQFYVKDPASLPELPPDARRKIQRGEAVLGDEFAKFVEDHTLSNVEWGVKVAKYLHKDNDLDFMRRSVRWVAEHRLVVQVRMALALSVSSDQLERAIKQNQPINVATMKKR